MPIQHDKQQRLKDEFNRLDENGDGSLSLQELKAMLKKGNPNMTERQIAGLYHKIDKDGDGNVNFNEFIDYLFAGHGQNRTTAGRHERIAAQSAPQETVEGPWEPVIDKVTNEFGFANGIESRDFVKIVTDAGLVDRKMNRNDADLIFTKCKTRNARKITLDQFQDAVRLVSQKRGVTVEAVQNSILATELHLHATVADNVRFHDDKSQYTGSHAQNERHGGSAPGSPVPGSRHDRVAAQQAAVTAEGEDEDEGMWDGAREKWTIFAGRNGQMENSEFFKLCQDAHLIGRGLNRNEVDVMFSRFSRHRKLEFEGYKGCIRMIASKRNENLASVLDKIEQCAGPVQHATQAENVRFHDDESQYTGSHRANRGLDDSNNSMDARRQRVARRAAEDSPEDDWEPVRAAYDEYATRGGEMDGKSFGDLIKFSGLLSRGFDRNQCDLIFAKVKPRGQRTIVFEEFQEALRFIGPEKGMTVSNVQRAVVNNVREVRATQAQYNRFHDDEDMYTGTHVGKYH